MKYIYFLILVLSTFLLHTQTIQINKSLGVYQFYQNNKKITYRETINIMKADGESYQLIKSAYKNNIIAGSLGIMGCLIIGESLSKTISGEKPNWKHTGIGTGLIVASIPIFSHSNKKSLQAVNKYNDSFSSSIDNSILESNLIVNGNGIGLGIYF